MESNLFFSFQTIFRNKNAMVPNKNKPLNSTNLKYQYNMKYVPSPRCNFRQEEETIKHMLWECQETKNLLKDFKRWLLNNNVNLTFVEELFIFNIGNTFSSADLHMFYGVTY